MRTTESLESFLNRGGVVKKLAIIETGEAWSGYRKKDKLGRRKLDASLKNKNSVTLIKKSVG